MKPLAFWKILHRAIAPRVAWAAMLACVVSFALHSFAQEERPQITPGERKAAKKKDIGPRALGVLRMTPDGKVSLVPIAILVDGKFWDAGAYKADPVPMALDSGVVYEGERAGNSLGLFTVAGALHSNAVNAPNPWIATGAWRPVGSEVPKENKTESAPVGIDAADEAPRLTRDPNAVKKTPANTGGSPPSAGAPGSAPPASSSPSNGTPSNGSPSNGDEPPRLKKGVPPPDSPPPAQEKPATTSGPDSKSSDSKPADKKSDDQSNVPASDSGAGETNRPRLRRGRPAVSFADEDVPGYSKPGESPKKETATIAQPLPAEADIQIVPAISDASGPQPRSYTFEWLKGEDDERRKQLTDMAKDQLRAYIAARAKAKIVPQPASQPARQQTPKRASKPQEPIFEKVQMIAYDLWNSNQPVIVFSAEAHMPPPPPGAPHSDVDSDIQYSILLVTYPDTYHNLRKIYSSVTDKFHLDITPRLDLVDAVDADGDGRGELLFRQTSDAGTGWVVYRAAADKLWKMFDSTQAQ
jgi:hypothetical protein